MRNRSGRFVRLYADVCEEQAARLQGPDVAEARRLLELEMPNVRLAFHEAAAAASLGGRRGESRPVPARIADALFVFHDVKGTLPTWLPFGDVGLESADRGAEPGLRCSLRNKVGVTFRMLGSMTEARRFYVDAAREAPDSNHAADCLTNLADLDRLEGRMLEALDRARSARELIVDDLNRSAKTYEYEGLALLATDDVDGAVTCYEQALSLRAEARNVVKIAFVHTLLGYALTYRGGSADLLAAQAHYEESLRLDRAINAHQALARFHGDYAGTLLALGKAHEALESARQALSENRQVSFRRGEALNLIRVACALHALGRRAEAAEAGAEAMEKLDLLTDFDRRMIAPLLRTLESQVLLDRGDPDEHERR